MSYEKCTSATLAVTTVCAIWLSGIVFLVACVIGLIWYIKKLSDSKQLKHEDGDSSGDFDVIDSRGEQLDLEQGLLSLSGREPRTSSLDLDSEGWQPVGMW